MKNNPLGGHNAGCCDDSIFTFDTEDNNVAILLVSTFNNIYYISSKQSSNLGSAFCLFLLLDFVTVTVAASSAPL